MGPEIGNEIICGYQFHPILSAEGEVLSFHCPFFQGPTKSSDSLKESPILRGRIALPSRSRFGEARPGPAQDDVEMEMFTQALPLFSIEY